LMDTREAEAIALDDMGDNVLASGEESRS
jgi:hypothetical protein